MKANYFMTPFTFPRSTPEAQGVDSRGILDFLDGVAAARIELHSLMLVRHGKVVAEGWWKPYSARRVHLLYSLSKSFTSTAIGFAVGEGLLSLEDKVISFFPDEAPAEVNEHLAAMTVHHLLSMNTGQAIDTTWHMISEAETWVKGFFEIPVVAAPGSHFLYNTGATYMLAAILHKVTGEGLLEYLTPRLFEPLGIQNAVTEYSPEGIATGGFGMSVTTEDIARLGQLYLQKGKWRGKEVLSEEWVAAATSAQSVNGYPTTGGDWTKGYGYQFWRAQHGAYRGDGAFGQYCLVLTEQDAVLAITAAVDNMQIPLDLVWANILPAFKAESLRDAPESNAALAARLEALAIAPLSGEATSDVAGGALGAWYVMDENAFDVKRLRLVEDVGGWTALEIETPRGVERTVVGYGQWTEGCSSLYAGPPRFTSSATVSSGAWITPDTWGAHIRLVETPTYAITSLAFVGEKVVFSNRLNVSMGPREFPPLVGTRE